MPLGAFTMRNLHGKYFFKLIKLGCPQILELSVFVYISHFFLEKLNNISVFLLIVIKSLVEVTSFARKVYLIMKLSLFLFCTIRPSRDSRDTFQSWWKCFLQFALPDYVFTCSFMGVVKQVRTPSLLSSGQPYDHEHLWSSRGPGGFFRTPPPPVLMLICGDC